MVWPLLLPIGKQVRNHRRCRNQRSCCVAHSWLGKPILRTFLFHSLSQAHCPPLPYRIPRVLRTTSSESGRESISWLWRSCSCSLEHKTVLLKFSALNRARFVQGSLIFFSAQTFCRALRKTLPMRNKHATCTIPVGAWKMPSVNVFVISVPSERFRSTRWIAYSKRLWPLHLILDIASKSSSDPGIFTHFSHAGGGTSSFYHPKQAGAIRISVSPHNPNVVSNLIIILPMYVDA